MKNNKRTAFSFGKTLMLLGLLLLIGAAGLYGYNQWVDHQAGQESEAAVTTLLEELQNRDVNIVEVEEIQKSVKNPEMLKVTELDGAYYMGILSIPALEKVLPVQSDWSEAKLKKSPCRYSGNIEDGELVISGHNYKKHFSGLATLECGDSVIFTDLEGNQISYEVREIYTVEATDIEGMVNSGYDLSLFTCNYGGKARVTVRCDRVGTIE